METQSINAKIKPKSKSQLGLSIVAYFCLFTGLAGVAQHEVKEFMNPQSISSAQDFTPDVTVKDVYLSSSSANQNLEMQIPFIESVIEKTYNYNYKSYETRVTESQSYFTPEGLDRFIYYITHTSIKNYVISHKLSVQAVTEPHLAGAIVTQLISDSKNIKYKIDVPVTMFYLNEKGKIFLSFKAKINMTLIQSQKNGKFLVDDLTMHGE